MAVSAARPLRWRPRASALARAPAAIPLALCGIVAVSIAVRVIRIGVGYWIDEGLSVGIAGHGFFAIPGVLQQDGSPPLYYLLLHLWISAFGSTTEVTTHALSLLFATLAVPVAWGFARTLLGPRASWFAAVLMALDPFLTEYAEETRMYSLVVLLGVAVVGCFLGAFVQRRGRRWTVGFAFAEAALLYTHNWALFLGAGLAAGWVTLVRLAADPEDRRALVREGVLAAVLILILWAPWLPTFLYQMRHTGAPWANTPGLATLARAPGIVLGSLGQYTLYLGLAAGVGNVLRGRARTWGVEARAALVLLIATLVTVLLPWALSLIQPAFANRYLAVAVPPVVFFSALVLARSGRVGLLTLLLVAALWATENGPKIKSNVRPVMEAEAPSLAPGDLVIVTQPELAPVVHYYATAGGATGLRWATLWGPLRDLGVTDWRDGVTRMQQSSPARDLEPLLARVHRGQRVLLIEPDFVRLGNWQAPWTEMVRLRSTAWEDAMRNDGRFRVVSLNPTSSYPLHPNPVRAALYVRVS